MRGGCVHRNNAGLIQLGGIKGRKNTYILNNGCVIFSAAIAILRNLIDSAYMEMGSAAKNDFGISHLKFRALQLLSQELKTRKA